MSEASNAAGQHVFIVGGANSAGQAAVYFARHAESVTILVRGTSLGSVDVPLSGAADRDDLEH